LIGPASDIYSLGATLYVMLTGRQPVVSDPDVQKILRMVRSGAVIPACEANPHTPRALEAICQKAMALRPEDRYASPHDLAADVERWLADEPVRAFREPLAARLGRWVRRHQTLATGVGVLLLT